jgi:oligopeptide/dipeptide ABC transporter ATP-binding protein
MNEGQRIEGLCIEGLRKTHRTRGGQEVRAIDGVSFHVPPGGALALVGESGCGKSSTARCIARLEEADAGSIRLDGVELRALSGAELLPMRRRLQMVFQDPYSSLDPRMTVARILAEPLIAHGIGTRAERAAAIAELLSKVGLPSDAATRLPAQFSGGQRQRIAIARALALSPEALIADEPVSALDVSVQAQIVNLLRDLKQERGIAMLVIAHDLALVHQLSDRVAVLYLGRVVEEGPADGLVARPLHPYTAALLSASPQPDPRAASRRIVLKGEPPSALDRPSGCAFHPRCPIARPACAVTAPPLAAAGDRRSVACFFPGELPGPLMGA